MNLPLCRTNRRMFNTLSAIDGKSTPRATEIGRNAIHPNQLNQNALRMQCLKMRQGRARSPTAQNDQA
jgi:hypothetical protein